MKIRSSILLALAAAVGLPLVLSAQSRTARLKSTEYPFTETATELSVPVTPECNIQTITVKTGTVVVDLNDGAQIIINRAGGFVNEKGTSTFTFGPPKLGFNLLSSGEQSIFMDIANQALGLVESAVTLYPSAELSGNTLLAALYAANRSSLSFDTGVVASVESTLVGLNINPNSRPRGRTSASIDIDGKNVVTPST